MHTFFANVWKAIKQAGLAIEMELSKELPVIEPIIANILLVALKVEFPNALVPTSASVDQLIAGLNMAPSAVAREAALAAFVQSYLGFVGTDITSAINTDIIRIFGNNALTPVIVDAADNLVSLLTTQSKASGK
jgi:hypothetical protein